MNKRRDEKNSVRFLRCLGLVGLLGLQATSATADFASALYDYGAENYTAAYDEFTRLASLGHKDSQFNLGAMYFRGQGAKQSGIEAYAWISLAAEDGDKTRIALRDRLLSKLNEADQIAARERAEALRKIFGEQALLDKMTPVYVSNEESQYKLIALENAAPEYPKNASRIGLSGSVDVEYSIDPDGHVKHYRVLESTNKIFNGAVIDALKRWRYQPVFNGEQAIEVSGVRQRIYFRIENDIFIEGETLDQYLSNLRYKAQSEVAVDMFFYAYVAELVPETKLQWEQINRWYFKAAQGGVPEAQYRLGRNLVYGKGCVADRSKGLEWLIRAARANYRAAQVMVAILLRNNEHPSVEPKQAQEFLDQAVQAKYPLAIIKKSWLLATSSDETQRDGARALELAKEVFPDYPDRLSAYQILAASQAEAGDFKAAQKTQKRTIQLAQKLKLPLDMEQKRLDVYNQNLAWRE